MTIPIRADGSPYPTATVRMFGRCWGKRCRTRAVVDVEVVEYTSEQTPTDAGRAAMNRAEEAAFTAGCCSATGGRPIMNGFQTEHGVMTWKGLRARRVETIACTSRCTSATSADCKCECGGERHGESA